MVECCNVDCVTEKAADRPCVGVEVIIDGNHETSKGNFNIGK